MQSIKKITKIFLIAVCLIALAICLSVTTAFAAPEDEVYLGGFTAGFTLNTQTVEVVGVCDVQCDEGMKSPARDCGIRTGDVIDTVNGIQVTSSNDLNRLLSEDFNAYRIGIIRDGKSEEKEIFPVREKSSGKKRFGLLVKDSLNGIGTVTYVNKDNRVFASLGHPVTDSCGNIININGGNVYGCFVSDVKKGLRGNPGELKGIFNNADRIGTVTTNCRSGIYGTLSDQFDTSKLTKIKVGSVSEATIGKAKIYSTVNGNEVCEYDVSIVKVDAHNKDNRNFVIKIDDEDLIATAGGIVQGMSGSPIVQDGKLIGAVTHVFVNDPTRGYGISVENMSGS